MLAELPYMCPKQWGYYQVQSPILQAECSAVLNLFLFFFFQKSDAILRICATTQVKWNYKVRTKTDREAGVHVSLMT